MEYYYMVIGVVFVAAFIIILVMINSKSSNMRKEQTEINNNVKTLLHGNDNFKQGKILYLNDYATFDQANVCKKFIAIDIENKKVGLVDYKKKSLMVVGFDEILNYEIYENGTNQTFGGAVGWFGSGIFGAETEGVCKELKLIIRLNRYDISQICYEIIYDNFLGVDKTSKPYKQCIATLQEAVSFLEVVKSENSKK